MRSPVGLLEQVGVATVCPGAQCRRMMSPQVAGFPAPAASSVAEGGLNSWQGGSVLGSSLLTTFQVVLGA